MPRIMIVEDDPYIMRVYERKFQAEGFTITTAKNGEEGLGKVQSAKPDIILLDLVMPKKDGFEFVRELRKDDSFAKTPIIVLTNLGQEHDIERAQKLGISAYLLKSNQSIQDVFEMVQKTLKGEKSL